MKSVTKGVWREGLVTALRASKHTFKAENKKWSSIRSVNHGGNPGGNHGGNPGSNPGGNHVSTSPNPIIYNQCDKIDTGLNIGLPIGLTPRKDLSK